MKTFTSTDLYKSTRSILSVAEKTTFKITVHEEDKYVVMSFKKYKELKEGKKEPTAKAKKKAVKKKAKK